MCEHSWKQLPGCVVCTTCGEERLQLDSSVLPYDYSPQPRCRTYSRLDRFLRVLINLRGQQLVDESVLQQIPRAKTVSELRVTLKRQNPKLLPKIASVWYQQGNRTKPLTPCELQKAKLFFREVHEKCSFLILVPWVLRRLNRQDLLFFVKPPSPSVLAKYREHLPVDVF